MYIESSGVALFKDLAAYGIRKPAGWDDACDGKAHISHQAWNAFYGFGESLAFHTWVPGAQEMDWLSKKYPDTFNKWYRPRLEHYASEELAGRRYGNRGLPMQCQTCQHPMFFTEPGNPRWIAYRETGHQNETFHFCSDHCKDIFSHEPQKYVQARLTAHQILQGQCFKPDADPAAPGFDIAAAVLDYCQIRDGQDNKAFAASEDEVNFQRWGGGQDPQEAQL